ncbi:hypothetical protein WJX84_001421 [Apatococcus fuscideae]|uniref:Uncharacterized protein n=1 Tax=Apatococcus fuscideae TaxID=2026836 RepID=A0AAW1TFW9_9CHLO
MSRPQKPVTIPQAPAYGYRDARRGSVDGAEALAVAWAEGLGLPQVPESDVLALLNDKWYGPAGAGYSDASSLQRITDSSSASTSSNLPYESEASSSSDSRSKFWPQSGWQLQIARTASTEGMLSQQSETSGLLLEGSVPEAVTNNSEATRKVIAMARRAQHLQQQQLLLEVQAEQRWSGAVPAAVWVGSCLPAVRADHFGSYVFVLILPGRVTSGRDKQVSSTLQLAQLASELIRTSLPPHFQVSIGESLS